jgi:heterodisulfide reductase subunit C2
MTRIRINDLDTGFKDIVAGRPGGEGFKACFACKACTAACPIEAIDQRYDPRRIIRMALLGMKKEILESDFIWYCSTCYACHEICPQNVSFTEVMFAIKNLAVTQACVPAGLTAQKNLLREHGRMYEISEFENEKREKLGLPPIGEHAEDYETLLIKKE